MKTGDFRPDVFVAVLREQGIALVRRQEAKLEKIPVG